MAWSENQRQAGDASLTYPRLAQHAEHYALAIARAEAFYLHNNLFLPKDGLLSLADRWQHIPGYIVHGRYDMVCQVEGAVALAHKWPRAELKILDDAGHSTFEDSIAKHLLATMENLNGPHLTLGNHALTSDQPDWTKLSSYSDEISCSHQSRWGATSWHIRIIAKLFALCFVFLLFLCSALALAGIALGPNVQRSADCATSD